MRWSGWTGGCLVAMVAAVAAGPLTASQERHGGESGLRGTVLDADTGTPLAGADVVLETVFGGLVSSDPGRGSVFLGSVRYVTTRSDGTYAFRGLGEGIYRLRVERIGYRGASVEVRYEGPADPRVSVALEVEPVRLDPVDVVAAPVESITPVGTPQGAAAGGARIAAERLRQDRHLGSDTRVLGDSDLSEAATLGETDLLRAIHRLPGVTADDDWSAEPWTRGSGWDETRVYFDGLPLFDPVHFGGAFTSVSPTAVGSLVFHPGVRSGRGTEESASHGVVRRGLRDRPAVPAGRPDRGRPSRGSRRGCDRVGPAESHRGTGGPRRG